METINANLTRMPEISVLGFPALMTPHKVSPSTVHFGLYHYELQGNLSDAERVIIVGDEIQDDFCGSLLTITPLLMQGAKRLILDPGDVVIPEYADHYTPAEFERKYYPG